MNELISTVEEMTRQRDAALNELGKLRVQLNNYGLALQPIQGYVGDRLEWFFPSGPYLAASPQRYTDKYALYKERAGMMRPEEDIAGFVKMNPSQVYDRSRFYFFCLVLDLINSQKIAGDMAELGVDKGNSASVLAAAAKRMGKKVYLLDTFEGFSAKDLVEGDAKYPAYFTNSPLDLVKNNVGVGDHIHYIKGYFPDSTSQMPNSSSFCLVHLDCDLYKPFASALEYFWPRLVPGGFLIMHDYASLYWDGVEKAVDDFFADKAESIVPVPDMSGTVVVRKSK